MAFRAFKAIADPVKAMVESTGKTLRDIEDITGVPASRISEIANAKAYLGPYASALAKVLGPEIFTLAIREAELRGLRPAAETAVGVLLARSGMVAAWGDDDLERVWRERMLERDLGAILSEDAVLVEVEKYWSRPAMKAGYAGSPELTAGELEIVREVIGEAIAEQTALQQKIRETSK